MTTLGFVIITAIDILGAFIISMSVFNPKLNHFSKCFKAGLVFLMLGLVGQAFRNVMFLVTGNSPTDASLPIWAFKDIGVTLVAVSWLWHKIK